MKLVVPAFPGTGKSTIFKNAEALGLKPSLVNIVDGDAELLVPSGPGIPVFDSDSSLFDKEYFPGNYIRHIKNVLSEPAIGDVVILVSSHDAVRKALAEEGIDYLLAYPEIELKEDYLKRYENRGSPENFINMMEHMWVKFVTDCQEDPTKYKLELKEGEYLIDRLKPFLGTIAGLENIGDVIIDVNGDAVIVSVPAEPDGDNDPSILDIPENSEEATLNAEKLKGGQPTVEDPTLDDKEEKDQTPPNRETLISGVESDRTDLIEASLEMATDLSILEPVIEMCKDKEAREGLECMEDNGAIFVQAVAGIKERYNKDIEPTLAGLEGFFDELKNAFTKIGEKLKGDKSDKAKLAIIKKYLYESEKAFNIYGSDKWQGEQKFINVGKVKLQVPELLETINSPGDVETILKLINKRTVDSFDKYFKNGEQRLRSAVKIFNTFKGKPVDTDLSEVDKMLPITPELLTGAVKDSGLSELKTGLKTVELPVLNKDAIKALCKVAGLIHDTALHFIVKDESTIDVMIPEDDFYESKFWDDHHAAKQTTEVWNASTCLGPTPEYELVSKEYGKQLLPVAKFLEMWILKSVK